MPHHYFYEVEIWEPIFIFSVGNHVEERKVLRFGSLFALVREERRGFCCNCCLPLFFKTNCQICFMICTFHLPNNFKCLVRLLTFFDPVSFLTGLYCPSTLICGQSTVRQNQYSIPLVKQDQVLPSFISFFLKQRSIFLKCCTVY